MYAAEVRDQFLPVVCDAVAEQARKVRLMRSFAKCEISLDDANGVLRERSSDDDGNFILMTCNVDLQSSLLTIM